MSKIKDFLWKLIYILGEFFNLLGFGIYILIIALFAEYILLDLYISTSNIMLIKYLGMGFLIHTSLELLYQQIKKHYYIFKDK